VSVLAGREVCEGGELHFYSRMSERRGCWGMGVGRCCLYSVAFGGKGCIMYVCNNMGLILVEA
jgi:hypothetical protein